MTKTVFMSTKEIATALEMTVATLRKNLPRLIERDGFPMPSPHCLKPMKWRRDAFERWLENLSPTADNLRATPPGQAPGTNVHMLQLARTA